MRINLSRSAMPPTPRRRRRRRRQRRRRRRRRRQIFFQNQDLVVAIKTVQKSSKSELSSRFLSRLKFYVNLFFRPVFSTCFSATFAFDRCGLFLGRIDQMIKKRRRASKNDVHDGRLRRLRGRLRRLRGRLRWRRRRPRRRPRWLR